ncbi:hypothetical protein M441DRAFT_50817 [Trichoderma asperellum CBS 433.97]|uniref:Uncharacterized protein n=1 Tax=Trichoderma asperellum (strain ATCC 204424 / CBS 433.97 / NBRC 101777) TaxID=1042311 RepID=A0A2T3YW42_TRIA4|nr:hypothetical protein M441DRAFT_50817 [Trichoderma asperellum CBS 433.97]PTB36781.1 hypothetical protein M441DRAFT_50817 [Trichoderma asperellum CBS 433.97]
MALPLLAAERQASPVCVWAGPRSGATARRPGMASTGHKVKVKRSWTQPSQKPLILVGQDPIIRRCAGDSPQAAPQPRDGVSSADPDGPYMYSKLYHGDNESQLKARCSYCSYRVSFTSRTPISQQHECTCTDTSTDMVWEPAKRASQHPVCHIAGLAGVFGQKLWASYASTVALRVVPISVVLEHGNTYSQLESALRAVNLKPYANRLIPHVS